MNARRVVNDSAERLASLHQLTNGSDGMRGNALPIPRDVWGEWDREAVQIQRSELAIFSDLAASVSRPMNIGKLISHFQTVSDSGSVNISLDGRSQGALDQPTFDYHGTPLPIIDSPFAYGWRQMAAASSEGFQLDSAGRDNANRKVAEKLESIALDGDTQISVDGSPLYGLRTHPKRNTRSTGVTLNGATGPEWVAEIKGTLEVLHSKNFKRGDKTVYLNYDDWFYASVTDYSSAYAGKSILQRIQEIPGVGSIIPADDVNADEIIALVKDSRVVQVLNGMPMTNMPFVRHNPTDDYEFAVMAAAALQIRFDAENQCGIVHSS